MLSAKAKILHLKMNKDVSKLIVRASFLEASFHSCRLAVLLKKVPFPFVFYVKLFMYIISPSPGVP